jgi:2-dehydro-3-deoxy-D-gluconate 5-dehydrogenase
MAGWGPFDITGKNVVVTGGAMGIGFGIVKRFVEGGANVLIADMNVEAAQAAAGKLEGGSGKVAYMKADVSQPDTGEKMVRQCVNQFGSIDVLVNNAGIYPQVPMMQVTPDLFDKVININLKGLAFCAKAAAARMIEQKQGGQIVNLASIDAIHPSSVGLAAYDASKGGVLMFTKNFALELAPFGIRVNAIAPGGIDTEGTATGTSVDAIREAFTQKIPLKRFGKPDDIAKVAVFLASSASDYMTGEVVVVDGGYLLT